MTTEITVKDKIEAVGTTLKSSAFRVALNDLLPPETIDRFTRVAITALQQNPDLLNKDRNSLFLAVRRCAEFGLNPDGREAALVAFGNTVVCMPMVGGLRRIAAKYGFDIATAVVHENDEFHYELGVDPVLRHIPAKLGTDRGQAVGAWAQAKGPDGQLYLEVMDKAQVEAVRQVSRAKSSGPWVAQWGEMARKTVARRLWKSLPMYDLSDQDARVGDARLDPEFEDGTSATETPATAQPAAGRPSVLDRVVASRAPAQDDGGVLEGEFVDASAEPAQPDPVVQPAEQQKPIDENLF